MHDVARAVFEWHQERSCGAWSVGQGTRGGALQTPDGLHVTGHS
jgi:hypothetical protein